MKNNFFCILFACIIFSNNNFAQQDSALVKKDSLDYYDMSLDQLMNLKSHGLPSELEAFVNSLIAVASKKPINLRESPSVTTLITKEEISKSGARDLIDVLRLVPGIDFGVDIEGVIGIGMRGNWANEGKVLVLLDGQEMNEIISAGNMFGNHYPIEQIKKIEVIRGPGSAIYGGYAEYGVVNIITNQAEDINGVCVSGTYGQMEKDYGRRNLNLSVGKKIKDFSFSLSGLVGQGQRSDQTYTDYSDSSYSMKGNSNINPNYVNLALGYKGLSFRAIGDFYQTTQRDGYGSVIKQGAVNESFNSIFSELKYVFKVNDKFTITPKINYKNQTPWKTGSYDYSQPYNKTGVRFTENITASYDAKRFINLIFGVESYQDKATDNTDSSFFANNKKEVNYHNYSVFTQGLLKTRFVNFIVGARFDKHSEFKSAFVPRIGLTKRYNKFHFKTLYSQGFRSPSIENINSADSAGIKPELTTVIEAELGYQITRNSILTANIYDITTHEPIIYYVSQDSSNTDYYTNNGHAGSQGVEIEYRYKDKWGFINFNYSVYSVSNKEKVAIYKANNAHSLLGFANRKINLNVCWNITKTLSFNTTATLYGQRFAVVAIDSLGNSVQGKLDPTLLLNFFMRYETPIKGLTVGLGVYDALNEKFKFIQPYDGGHAPLPGPSREIIFRVQYNLNFKK
jgi:outer membrane receptor for ferrienterochelin and colicin